MMGWEAVDSVTGREAVDDGMLQTAEIEGKEAAGGGKRRRAVEEDRRCGGGLCSLSNGRKRRWG